MSILNKGLGADKRSWYIWLACIIGCCFILKNLWSQFYPFIMDMYALEARTEVAFSNSCLGFGNLIIGPVIYGYLFDKFGPKPCFAMSAVCMVIALICSQVMFSFADWESAKMWWYACGFITGLGFAGYSTAGPSTAIQWNPDRIGKTTGLANAGTALAPVWAAPVCAIVISNWGPSAAFLVLFGWGLFIVVALGLVLFRRPDKGWLPEGYTVPKENVAGDAEGLQLKDIMKKKEFWMLWFCCLVTCIAGMFFSMNLSFVLMEGLVDVGGMDADYVKVVIVATAMSFTAIANAVSRAFWGWMMDKVGSAWNCLLVSYIGMFFLLFIFQFVYSNVITCIAFMFILYLFYGGQSPLHQGCAPYVFGRGAVGSLMSAMLFATGIAMLIAPTLGAYIADATGAYINVFFVSAALMAVATVVMFILRNISNKRLAAEAAKGQ